MTHDWEKRITEGDAHSIVAKQALSEVYRRLALPADSVKLTGWNKFNTITGGFREREFSILCGGTGTGKTTLLSNWSASLATMGVPHFVASVETGHIDYIARVISVLAGEDWNTGDPVPIEKIKKFSTDNLDLVSKMKLYVSLYDNRFSVKKLINDIAWNVKHNGVKIAFVDNLNFFLEVTSIENAIVEMDRVIHDLIIFCKQCPVHIVMVMHPKKMDDGRVESEFEIKGSSTAVQEAHNIFLFNRPHQQLIKENRALPGDRELKLQKMRRRGKYVGRTMLLETINEVKYVEKLGEDNELRIK